MQNDERTPKYVAYVENILQEMKTTESKQILKVDVKQTRLRRAKSESGTLSKCFPIKLTFQIQYDINPNIQNIKFKQFTIKFDILTQKHYESDLIRSEIENQSKRYTIEPKINMWCDQYPSNQIINFELIRS